MNVLMLTFVSTKVDPYYLSIARSVAGYLADRGFDLVFGGGSQSMCGICYQEFLNKGRNIYAITTEKYISDLDDLKYTNSLICKSTFELKRNLFNLSDFIVALPGGIGTLSEILSFAEENRSNDKNIPIILYDEDYYYENLFNIVNVMKNKGFFNGNIDDLFCITHEKDEFVEKIDDIVYKKEKKLI